MHNDFIPQGTHIVLTTNSGAQSRTEVCYAFQPLFLQAHLFQHEALVLHTSEELPYTATILQHWHFNETSLKKPIFSKILQKS